MSAFYLEDKDGVKNYIKSIDTANETIEWTTRPDRDRLYTNSSGFFAESFSWQSSLPSCFSCLRFRIFSRQRSTLMYRIR